jgi:hypothetical protein
MLSDKRYDKLHKAMGPQGIAFLGLSIGQYLASLTELPIDFQIQRSTEANALHGGKVRNPIGCRDLGSFLGDAQPDQVAQMLKNLPSISEEE